MTNNTVETGLSVVPAESRLHDQVYYRHWALESPVAVILLAHGLGEHSGRYQGFAEFMAARRIAVVAPDHVGHGESPGARVYCDSCDDFMTPLDTLRDLIDEWYPGQPCFLVGHSMGGLIGAYYLLKHQGEFAGAALSGAALQASDPPSPVMLWIARLLSRVWPTVGLLALDATQISRDAAVVRRYRDDPLVHNGKVSARLVTELFTMMDTVAAQREHITLPLLVMHGAADAMTAPEGSEVFHQAIASEDKSLRIYPELYHEIFNEPERETVLEELSSWILQRVPPSD